jgi:hypothetical protein
MVKGKCRGINCDFWARVRIRKRSEGDLISHIINHIEKCESSTHQSLDSALEAYWRDIGIRNMNLLCQEEPELCEKIQLVEQIVARQIG